MKSAAILFAAIATAARCGAAAPELDYPVQPYGQAARVLPFVPVGKTVLIPVTAHDADGDPLSYKVTSSSADILVRVKTGNPTLRMEVSHANGGADDPAYTGTMEFMLFADWLPITSGYVAGMAQGGFYDNVLFHRIADLGGGVGTTGFIFQGGDPLGTGGGGPGMTDNDPTTAWKFQNEFHPATTFTGRGQLAMANAGTQTGYSLGSGGTLIVPDYLDTNGSQFFITDGQPRHLDFKHNVFGQLMRGWELLPKIRATKTTSSRPDYDLKITSATVVPNETDAVLVITAKGYADSLITITATDPSGESGTTSFFMHSVPDTVNSQPFLRRMPAQITRRDTPSVFALQAVDLEFDYLDIQHSLLPLSATVGPKGSLLAQSGRVAQVAPFPGYSGLINMGFSLRQYDVAQGGFDSISDYTNAYIAAGERMSRPEGGSIEATPGVALANVVAGKLFDTDPGSNPANFTAKINWGDGSPITQGTVTRDTSEPGAAAYLAIGGHTYARPGVYPVVVDFSGNNGGLFTARGTARATTSGLRAASENLSLTTGAVVERLVATFTDANARPMGDYSAAIDWGDGVCSAGKISRDPETGRFLVRGSHGYRDSEPFSVRVRIHNRNQAPAEDAFAWSRIEPVFTATPHLPPFPHPKLTIAWNSGPTKTQAGTPGSNYQVRYNGVFVIINTGNVKLSASKLRFWLSNDRTLNKTGLGAAIPVKVNDQKELNIIPFPAGAGGSGNFVITMPKGQSTGRKFLLAEADYHDKIADYDGTGKVIASGPLPGSILLSATSGLTTTEAGGTATFTVVLDTPPDTPSVSIASIIPGAQATINTTGSHGLTTGNEVLISGVTGSTPDINGVYNVTSIDADTFTIPLNVTTAGSGGKVQINPKVTIPLESSLTSEGTVLPASLTFTKDNWNVPQTVTVTGVDDTIVDGNKTYTISLKAAVSADSLYNGFVGGTVGVTNTDNDTNP